MAVFMVTYDLHRQGQNYTGLIARLKAYETYWHPQQSVWIVETQHSAVQIRDYLRVCLDENDKLLVARLSGEAAWIGHTSENSQWLKCRLETQMRV